MESKKQQGNYYRVLDRTGTHFLRTITEIRSYLFRIVSEIKTYGAEDRIKGSAVNSKIINNYVRILKKVVGYNGRSDVNLQGLRISQPR